MLKIQESVDISSFTTFNIKAIAQYFTILENKEDILELISFSKNKDSLPIYLLGSGSNTIFGTEIVNKIVVLVKIKGFSIFSENSDSVVLQIGAGEDWDEIVNRIVIMNLSGVEALSYIPSTVGAAPVQNIGAYGQEVKNTIISVECFDLKTKAFVSLSNENCNFGYRESVFNRKEKGRYIILSVNFKLSKIYPQIPNYPDVEKYFIQHEITKPTLLQIREAIIEIRKSKLPDPKIIPNCGSFFKNPILDIEIVNQIQKNFPDIKIFPAENNKVKIPAGWLIEKAGLKGVSFGPISVYEKSALVLVNKDKTATIKDLENAITKITEIVYEKFGINLEVEPNIVF
ncbi:MAG: UDP-N-acetylmuramate dehydrogenase [Candidatus Nomurabacteria bacterium]|nr:UDP-N-acetylmuramate dehydrogenase [Candidatus Nomurabacteria bacterium]